MDVPKIKSRTTSIKVDLKGTHEERHVVASVLSSPNFKRTVMGLIEDVVVERQGTLQRDADDIHILFGRVKELEDQLKKKNDWFSMLQSKVMDFDLE